MGEGHHCHRPASNTGFSSGLPHNMRLSRHLRGESHILDGMVGMYKKMVWYVHPGGWGALWGQN